MEVNIDFHVMCFRLGLGDWGFLSFCESVKIIAHHIANVNLLCYNVYVRFLTTQTTDKPTLKKIGVNL